MASAVTLENAEGNQVRIQNYIFTNLTTWVRGKHTLKFGGEYRYLANMTRRLATPTAASISAARLPGSWTLTAAARLPASC